MAFCLRLMCLAVLVLAAHVMLADAAVTVKKLRARDLAGDALGNKPEPYVRAWCNGVSGGRTSTKPGTSYPSWDDEFGFINCKPGHTLKMIVYDEDVKDDDTLGTCKKIVSKGTFTDVACAMDKKGTLIYNLYRMTMTPTVEGRRNVVIMGRKTWFSIPAQSRPLKNRINIVLSKELKEPPEGVHYLASDFSSALRLLDTPELAEVADQVWIIGGSSVYKEAMESAGHKRLFVTRIQKQFDCDTFIPNIDLDKYKLLPEFSGVPGGIQEENGLQYVFEVYESTDH